MSEQLPIRKTTPDLAEWEASEEWKTLSPEERAAWVVLAQYSGADSVYQRYSDHSEPLGVVAHIAHVDGWVDVRELVKAIKAAIAG